MELLLLLLEVQKDTGIQHLSGGLLDFDIFQIVFLINEYCLEPLLDANSFPLLVASVSSAKMFVSSPLSFIENQCYDLLSTIADLASVPDIDNHVQKVVLFFGIKRICIEIF